MTNVNDNETNGIADEVTLPEGDAVAILRKYASFWGASHATHTQCDSNWEVTTMHTLADMVERDYVSREYLDEVRSEADYREGLLHESIDDLEAERDELKSRHCPHYHVDRHYCDVHETRIEALIAERDEWKAKAEACNPCGWWNDSLQYCERNDDLPSENDVSANDVDANDANATQDSREKLEADVRRDFATQNVVTILGWLDRQAAITHAETIHTYNLAAREVRKVQDERIAELQEKVDEQRKSLEAAWEDNAELITKVDALTQANADYRDEWHRVCHERDDLQRKLHESNRERERLRKQLGIAIDHAHDMIALVSVDTDEGLA